MQWNNATKRQNGIDFNGLRRQQCYRTIRVSELCDDGVQKRREKMFSFTSCFSLKFSSSKFLPNEELRQLG
jgi:hypothetical protein